MSEVALVPLVLALGAGMLSVGFGFAVYSLLDKRRPIELLQPPQPLTGSVAVFLFRDGVLIDANEAALKQIEDHSEDAFSWSDLRHMLEPGFPGFPAAQGTVRTRDTSTLCPSDPNKTSLVLIDQWTNHARVTVHGEPLDRPSIRSMSWRAVLDAPNPIWQTDENGHVIWSNPAFDAVAASFGHDTDAQRETLFDIGVSSNESNRRIGITDATLNRTSWFDVVTVPSGEAAMHYATDANAVVNAEIAQRNFVQTLTKTFAQLSIGLAIFDRNRQLALFNPALIDLTTLPADFLSGRPSLMAFFDRMREKRVMPEPKNYATWREHLTELVVAAADGRYSETWSLPSGLTYRVTGRPHPDGAIAFLFEDISAEISLTRRFRADIELGVSVLDSIEDAVVVFSSDGHLQLCNRAYRDLWRTDPDTSIAQYALRDALPVWKAESQTSGIWDRLREAILGQGDRLSWDQEFVLKSGQVMTLRVQPVDRGATLVRFSHLATDETPPLGKTVQALVN